MKLFSLRIAAEALWAKIDWWSASSKELGHFGQKFQVQWSFSTNHSSCRKTRWMDLLYGIRILADFFLSITVHAFDRRTDGQTFAHI